MAGSLACSKSVLSCNSEVIDSETTSTLKYFGAKQNVCKAVCWQYFIDAINGIVFEHVLYERGVVNRATLALCSFNIFGNISQKVEVTCLCVNRPQMTVDQYTCINYIACTGGCLLYTSPSPRDRG